MTSKNIPSYRKLHSPSKDPRCALHVGHPAITADSATKLTQLHINIHCLHAIFLLHNYIFLKKNKLFL